MLFGGLFLQSVLTFSGSQYSATTSNLAITAALTAALAAAGAVSGGGLNPGIATALYLKNATKDQARLLWLYWVGVARARSVCVVDQTDTPRRYHPSCVDRPRFLHHPPTT